MNSITDEQRAIQYDLDRLRQESGMEEDFANHQAINLMTIRIFRFLCEDQEWLDRVPAADGSNLMHSDVWRTTYNWFKMWLSRCHLQRVSRPKLRQVFDHAAADLRLEKATHYLSLIDAETKHSPDMAPFRKLYDQQAAALAGRSENQMVPLLEPDCEILAELMLAESGFEKALRGTHVEDVLLEKRFDRDQLNDGSHPDPLLEIRRIHDVERDGWWIRQLRQHGFRRPWRQLYLIIDDGIGQQYTQAMNDVADLFQDRRHVDREHENEEPRVPRMQRALDVQPMALSAMRDRNCAAMCGRHDDEEDGIEADFGEGDIAIFQSCGQHWIHGTCAFRAWDVHGQNNFSFPCPLCRADAGRLSDKLELDIEEDNYNVGFDPEVDQEYAFRMIQENLHDDFTLLERQHEFPAAARRKALREQRRLLAYADEQDRYYDNVLAGWDTNPQNPTMRRPVHPHLRGHHHSHWYHLYGFEQDDYPPRYPEAHWHEQAIQMIENGERLADIPEHFLIAWRQWMDREGFEQMVGVADMLAQEVGGGGNMEDFAADEAAYAAEHNANDEDEEEDGEGGDQAEGGDQEMGDAGEGDGGGNGDDVDGQGRLQNAFARWRKVDAREAPVGGRVSGKSAAAEVRAVRAMRRSPRLKRMVAARG